MSHRYNPRPKFRKSMRKVNARAVHKHEGTRDLQTVGKRRKVGRCELAVNQDLRERWSKRRGEAKRGDLIKQGQW